MGAKPVMSLAGGSIVGLFTAAAVWGLGFGGVPTTVLTWGARTEPARLEQLGGIAALGGAVVLPSLRRVTPIRRRAPSP